MTEQDRNTGVAEVVVLIGDRLERLRKRWRRNGEGSSIGMTRGRGFDRDRAMNEWALIELGNVMSWVLIEWGDFLRGA